MVEILTGTRKHPSTSKKTRRAAMRDARIKVAREAAEERQAASAALSPQERLDRLDRKLGKGMGACKERARLQRLLEASQTKPETVVEAEAKGKTSKKAQ